MKGHEKRKKLEKQILKQKFDFLAFNTPRPSMSVHSKFQSSRLARYRQQEWIYLVLMLRNKNVQ